MTVQGQKTYQPVDLATALAVVGLTRAEVLDVGGSVLAAGPAFLVGSLAGGLGNRGSDVDIHLLVPGITKPSPPFLFFVRDTPIDIEHYPEGMPAALVKSARAFPVRELPIGTVSLAPAPGRQTRHVAARWLSALPLYDDQPSVFDATEARVMLPLLVRAALDQVLQMWSAARLADRAHLQAVGYLWSRAARNVLELRCHAGGNVVTGEKWLPDRAAQLGFDLNFVTKHYGVTTEAAFMELLDGTGIEDWDPWLLTELHPDPNRRPVRLGREEFVLTRHGRLLDTAVTADAVVAEVAEELPAGRLVDAVRDGELALEVSGSALEGVLRG